MIKNIVRYLIYLTIIATPLFTITEYIAMMQGLYVVSFLEATDYRIKMIKDLALIIIIMLSILYLLLRAKIKMPNIIIIIGLIISSFFIGLANNGLVFSFISLRIYMPILLLIVAFNMLSDNDYEVLYRIIIYLGCSEIFIAISQMIFGVGTGTSFFGIYKRVVGTFAYSNAFAIYMVMVNSILLAKRRNCIENILLFISTILIFISGSAAGIACMCIIYILYILFNKERITIAKLLIAKSIVLFTLIIIVFMPVITARDGVYSRSAGGRLVVFFRLLENRTPFEILFGRGIGVGTNTTKYLLESKIIESKDTAFISDSQYVSIFAQAGLLGLSVYIMISIYMVYLSYKYRYKIGMYIFPIILFYNLSGNILEIFPLNWIYPILAARAFQLKYLNHIDRVSI